MKTADCNVATRKSEPETKASKLREMHNYHLIYLFIINDLIEEINMNMIEGD